MIKLDIFNIFHNFFLSTVAVPVLLHRHSTIQLPILNMSPASPATSVNKRKRVIFNLFFPNPLHVLKG